LGIILKCTSTFREKGYLTSTTLFTLLRTESDVWLLVACFRPPHRRSWTLGRLRDHSNRKSVAALRVAHRTAFASQMLACSVPLAGIEASHPRLSSRAVGIAQPLFSHRQRSQAVEFCTANKCNAHTSKRSSRAQLNRSLHEVALRESGVDHSQIYLTILVCQCNPRTTATHRI
jgi:hypothetical protein